MRLAVAAALFAAAMAVPAAASTAANTAVDRLLCRTIEASARANGLPVAFFARLVWQESSFQPMAVSRKGAEGIAQFTPGTAAERGLADPFDPARAIAEAARLLAALRTRFGNLGLAAAAYNAGARRIARWLQAQAELPAETRGYVLAVTGRPVAAWAAAGSGDALPDTIRRGQSCLALTAALRRAGGARVPPLWQVRLDSNLARAVALIGAFAQARRPASAGAAAEPAPPPRAAALCATARSLGIRCEVVGR